MMPVGSQYIWRLIKLIPNLQKHTCCKFLAAKCHVALEEWEESLEVIGSPELISTKDADVDDSFSPIPNVQRYDLLCSFSVDASLFPCVWTNPSSTHRN